MLRLKSRRPAAALVFQGRLTRRIKSCGGQGIKTTFIQHGRDLDFPDTDRLKHIAWLAHRTLPYALSLAGQPAAQVRCELTAPDGGQVWRLGPADAESAITGMAGEFCRVAAQRLDPARSGLQASGPHGATALRLVRTYAA